MATLNGQQISATYEGLIKTANNQAGAPFPPAKLQYGDGTDTPITIGDGSGIGLGDIVTLTSGTRNIDLNSNNLALNGITTLDPLAGTATFVNGTFNWGLPFPGAPATSVDFTNATVTGLPASTDTTYDLASAQAAANATITLTGSDATTDTITLAAGTNITLTDNGSNQITIDAAGGSGAAGLVNGTGTNSLINAAALTTNPALAPTTGSISLGDGATIEANATRPTWTALGHIAIGKGALVEEDSFTDAYNNACIAIGDGAIANPSYDGGTIAIGDDAHGERMHAIAIGADTVADQFAIAMGQNAGATGGISISIGRNSDATSTNGIALGEQALASAIDAVAIGKQVTAATANTVSVKALEIQTDSTPTAGGIIMSDAGGTDRRLNIDASGNLQIDSAPATGAVFTLPRVGGLVQASGCDVIQSSVLIPANTFKAGDMWQLTGADSATGSTGFVYSAFWISTTGTVGNAATEIMNLGQNESSAAAWSKGYQKTIYVGTQDGTGIGSEVVCSGCASDADGTINSGMVTYTPDWTSDLYLVARVCVDNSGATYVNHGATLRKIN